MPHIIKQYYVNMIIVLFIAVPKTCINSISQQSILTQFNSNFTIFYTES